MKKIILLLSIATLLLIVAGCEKKEGSKETFKSYEYYQTHTQEMLIRFEECEKIDYLMSKVEHEECDSVTRIKGVYNLRNKKNKRHFYDHF